MYWSNSPLDGAVVGSTALGGCCEVCLRYSYQKPARNGLYADGL